ncbi:hypothetical protein V6Z12_D07G092800 [Gossypium hirsutum]
MALYFMATSLNPKPCSNSNIIVVPPLLYSKPKHRFKLISSSSSSSCGKAFAQSEGKEGGVKEEDPPAFSGSLSSTRTQLDLLDQLSSTSSTADGYESDGRSGKLTIREQLVRLVGDRDDDFTIPLGKNLKKVMSSFFLDIHTHLKVNRNIEVRRTRTYVQLVIAVSFRFRYCMIGLLTKLSPPCWFRC